MLDQRAFGKFRKNPAALASAGILLVVSIGVIVGPLLLPVSYAEPGPLSFAPPSRQHPFGTDLNGRDLLYRVLAGGRISLLVGLCGACVSLFIGAAYGLVAGYCGGRLDNLMMRIVDILYSIPRLIFILICINAFNSQLQEFASQIGWDWLVTSSRIAILIVSLGVIEWLTLARIVRGQTPRAQEPRLRDSGDRPGPVASPDHPKAPPAKPRWSHPDLPDVDDSGRDHRRIVPKLPRAGRASARSELGIAPC